jgi:hypothetical protein
MPNEFWELLDTGSCTGINTSIYYGRGDLIKEASEKVTSAKEYTGITWTAIRKM